MLAVKLEDWKERALVHLKAGVWDFESELQSEELSEGLWVDRQVDLV